MKYARSAPSQLSSEQQTFSIEIQYIITFEELTTSDRA